MAFKKIETRELPDIQSTATVYQHDKTGARVLRLANEDPNKAFMIGFRTPPYSDNGITHIIEHAVLNGSEKYPSKEPFVEIIKGSLNTFVNAITYPDKTVYPIASTNQKDFMNLMSVYMDAVFRPNLRHDSQILAQEGWHYHLENLEDDLIYTGVVYNEMKGATASPEVQLYNILSAALYPDSAYRHESGGHPRAIPDLTYEEFVDYHATHYHPSNSFTILYGDMEEAPAFNLLEEYFETYEKSDEVINLAFTPTAPVKERIDATYSITDGEDPAGKTFLTLAWDVLTAEDQLDLYGMEVLCEILMGNNESPLKKALLEAQVGGSIEGSMDPLGYVDMFNITAKYSDVSKLETFKQVVHDTLTQLVQEGIPTQLIDSALNKIGFKFKEAAISESNPRGVIFAIQSLAGWLYDEAPYLMFEFSHYLEEVAKRAKSGYLETLIQEKLLDNPHRVEVVLEAEPGKNDRAEAAVLEKLQEYKASLSQEELEAIVESTHQLMERQSTPDKPEDLDKIPSLQRSDLTIEQEDYNLTKKDWADFGTFYVSEQFTSGIDYINLYFDLSDFEAKDYIALGLLSNLLTNVSTENHSLSELKIAIDSHTGGIDSEVVVLESRAGLVKPYFVIKGKALHDQLETLVDLLHDVATASTFTNKTEVQNVVAASISDFEQLVDFRANMLAAARAASQLRPGSKLADNAKGIEFFSYLNTFRKEFESDQAEAKLDQLRQVFAKLLHRDRFNAHYIGDAAVAEEVQAILTDKFATLSTEPMGEAVHYQPGSKRNEAFITSQDVNYVVLGADSREAIEFRGSSLVMANIANYDFLWNVVRVQGGAYGAGYRNDRSGRLCFTSYRDPHIARTLEVYHQLPDYLAEIDISEEALLKKIIGTYSSLIQPKSAYDKGAAAFFMDQQGVTTEDLLKLKQEVLDTTLEEIHAYQEPLYQALQDSTVVVIGNKVQIEKNADLFDQIETL